MGGHIVRTFNGVGQEWQVLWGEAVEVPLEVHPDRWVGILIDGQSGTCVLDEQVQQPFHWQFADLAKHLDSYQVEPTRMGW